MAKKAKAAKKARAVTKAYFVEVMAQSLDDMELPAPLASFSGNPTLVAEYDLLSAKQVRELATLLAQDDAAMRVWDTSTDEILFSGSIAEWTGIAAKALAPKVKAKAKAKAKPAAAKKAR